MAKNMDFHIANFLLIWNCRTLVSNMHFNLKIRASKTHGHADALWTPNLQNSHFFIFFAQFDKVFFLKFFNVFLAILALKAVQNFMKVNSDCAKKITFRRCDQNMEFHITEILKEIIDKKNPNFFFFCWEANRANPHYSITFNLDQFFWG